MTTTTPTPDAAAVDDLDRHSIAQAADRLFRYGLRASDEVKAEALAAASAARLLMLKQNNVGAEILEDERRLLRARVLALPLYAQPRRS